MAQHVQMIVANIKSSIDLREAGVSGNPALVILVACHPDVTLHPPVSVPRVADDPLCLCKSRRKKKSRKKKKKKKKNDEHRRTKGQGGALLAGCSPVWFSYIVVLSLDAVPDDSHAVVKIGILGLALWFVINPGVVELEGIVASIDCHADDWAGVRGLHQGVLVALLHRHVAGEVGLDGVRLLVALSVAHATAAGVLVFLLRVDCVFV